MPISLPSPSLRVPVVLLTAEAFAPYGTVVENPLRNRLQESEEPLPANAVYANQGSALKILDVTNMTNFYSEALSKQAAKAVMNIFVCSPRELRLTGSNMPVSKVPVSFDGAFDIGALQNKQEYLFDVKILERHPYTFQTFIPTGLDRQDKTTCYLVIVAPTLPNTNAEAGGSKSWKRPLDNFLSHASASLTRNSSAPYFTSIESGQRKGIGQPDLKNLRAFLANGSQAVTYGAGTWHAPMVVLGMKKVEFVVVQFANGLGEEDCQERELMKIEGEEGIAVVLEVADAGSNAALGESPKARL